MHRYNTYTDISIFSYTKNPHECESALSLSLSPIHGHTTRSLIHLRCALCHMRRKLLQLKPSKPYCYGMCGMQYMHCTVQPQSNHSGAMSMYEIFFQVYHKEPSSMLLWDHLRGAVCPIEPNGHAASSIDRLPLQAWVNRGVWA